MPVLRVFGVWMLWVCYRSPRLHLLSLLTWNLKAKVWLIRQSFRFCLLTWRDRPFLSEKLLPPRKRRAVKSGEPYSPKKRPLEPFHSVSQWEVHGLLFITPTMGRRPSLSPHLRRDRELHLALCPKDVSNIQRDLFALNISGFISKPLFMFSDLVWGHRKKGLLRHLGWCFPGFHHKLEEASC